MAKTDTINKIQHNQKYKLVEKEHCGIQKHGIPEPVTVYYQANFINSADRSQELTFLKLQACELSLKQYWK